MRLLTLLSILTPLVWTASLDHDLNSEWEEFKSYHKKQYSPAEEAVRRTVWEENLKRIAIHNLEASMGKHTYTLGMNAYGDMGHEEFLQNISAGCLMKFDGVETETETDSARFLPSDFIQVPQNVDWRKKQVVTRIKNQGHCGSCWAFSTTGSVEGQYARKYGKLVELSEQQLVDCSTQNNGCNGGMPDRAFSYIRQNRGIDSEVSYPYEGREGPCRFKRRKVVAKVVSHANIQWGDETALTKAIASVGPISVAIDASDPNLHLYHSGVFYSDSCSSTRINHAVLAVGYGTQAGHDFYIVKNSWGETWGDKGYILMTRNRDNNCGIATAASFPIL